MDELLPLDGPLPEALQVSARMKLPPALRHLVLMLAALSMIGCAEYSTVREKRPKVELDSLSSALLKRALTKPSKDPSTQIGRYLNVASLAASTLEKRPDHAPSRRDYNFAIARIFEVVHENGLEPWHTPIRCPGPTHDWTFSVQMSGNKLFNPSLFLIRPADRFQFKGKLVKDRVVKDGLGAPMVTTSKVDFTSKDPFIMGEKSYYGMTVLLNFKGEQCVASYYDPLSVETVQFQGHEYPLAADFTAPIGLALAEIKPRKTEIERMMRPDEYAGTSRLARLQPYEAKKIPILVIHGLGDSQATWAPMIETLRGDPVIRQNYQFWFFSYPTGYPFPFMAADLRRQLDKMNSAYRGHKKFVVIGHSMGGNITRVLMTDSGTKIWDAYFDVPPEKLPLSSEARETVKDTLIFRHRSEFSRVIFCSASLGGSDIATGFLGRMGNKIIGRLKLVLGDAEDTNKAVTFVKPGSTGKTLHTMPTSIDALAPNNRFLTTLNSIPVVKGIPYHSIIGDRGKGGNKDHTKPMSSDGVVPYWSSHIDGAQSELIVPSGHWSNQNPEAIAEVRRILHEHLKRN